MARAFRAAHLLCALLTVATVHAEHPVPHGPVVAPGAVVVPGAIINPSYCWTELKLFDSLRWGPVDFCRQHLAYRPGRLECLQVGENVCWVQLGVQWTLTRTPTTQYVIACPDGPEPPVCPRMTFR